MKYFRDIVPWLEVRTFYKYLGANVTYQAVTLLADICVVRVIEVRLVGVWQYALLLQSYVIISRLGIINAFNRDYGYLKASGADEIADKIAQTTAFHVTISKIAQAIFFFSLGAYYYSNHGDDHFIITLFVMIGYTCFEASINFEEAKLRANLEFSKISKGKILASVSSIVFLCLPLTLRYNGLLLRAILIQIVLVIYFRKVSNNNIKPSFSCKQWIRLFKDGWKIWIWSYLGAFNKTLPRLYVVTFSGFADLGLFAPVNWMIMAFTLITSSLGEYLYPHFTRRLAHGDNNLPQQSLIINLVAFLCLLPITLAGYLIIPWLISNILPGYIEVITPMRIALIASAVDVFNLSTMVWVASRDWVRMWGSVFVGLVIRICTLAWVYFSESNTLTQVSKSMVWASILSMIASIGITLSKNAQVEKKASILSL